MPAARSPPPTGRTTGRQPYGQHQCTESRALADHLARGYRAVQPRTHGRRGAPAAPRQDTAAPPTAWVGMIMQSLRAIAAGLAFSGPTALYVLLSHLV